MSKFDVFWPLFHEFPGFYWFSGFWRNWHFPWGLVRVWKLFCQKWSISGCQKWSISGYQKWWFLVVFWTPLVYRGFAVKQWEIRPRTHTTGTHHWSTGPPPPHTPGTPPPPTRSQYCTRCVSGARDRFTRLLLDTMSRPQYRTGQNWHFFNSQKPTCQNWHFREKSRPNPHNFWRKCHFWRFWRILTKMTTFRDTSGFHGFSLFLRCQVS